MSLFDETIDNGWVPIRRNLLPHLANGRLTSTEFITLIYLLLTVSAATGETQTCASVIADLHGWEERHTQKALKALRIKGYIEAEKVQGRRGLYKVRVLKFVRTTGSEKGLITLPNLAVRRYRDGGVTGSETAVKTSLTAAVRETSQASENNAGYKPAVTGIDGDGGGDAGGETAVTRYRDGGGTAVIQERHSDKNNENESVCMSVGGPEAPSPVPVQVGQEKPLVAESLVLVKLFFAHQGKPEKFKASRGTWKRKFESLLAQHSFESIKGTMAWAFDVSEFWPKHLIRFTEDPLDYFLSKFDKLKVDATGHLKATRNLAKQAPAATAGKQEKPYPEMSVCNNDPVAEMMARMAREGAAL